MTMARVRPYVPFNGDQVQADGLTVSCSDGFGRARTLVRQRMPLDAALREIVLQLDEWPGDWRIDAISTPRTIYRDLQGTRSRAMHDRTWDAPESYPQIPEREMLGRHRAKGPPAVTDA